MNIVSMIRHMYKYRFRGIYNDLNKYLINILKFYSQGLIAIFGALMILILFSQAIITIEDINTYFNYILPVAVIIILSIYMYSPLTLIIFSYPDIFYLIRKKSLFSKIALIDLIKKNVGMILTLLGASYFISHNITVASFIGVLVPLLLIPTIANIKFYLFNKYSDHNLSMVVIIIFSVQALYPNIYLIILEYFISIGIVVSVLNNLNLEKLIPICEYTYKVDRIIKVGHTTNNANDTNVSLNKSKTVLNDVSRVNRKSIYFKYKKELAFFIKDCKSMKSRAISINTMFIGIIISIGLLNILFPDYKLLYYIILYLFVNSQLKSIFNNNYYMLFNKMPLCSSIKAFIKETSYFSIAIYTLVNTILLILESSLYYSIPFILLISVSSALVSSYNSSKNLNISIFSLINIALTATYIILDSPMTSISLLVLYSIIIYKLLYNSIKSKVILCHKVNP